MSKRSLFWGNASGKLGEAVYYRAGGEQRTRAWVPVIKNPKTERQAANRISMLNLVSAYKSLKPILSKSFPLRPTNQSGFNAFVSANKNYMSAACSKNMLDYGVFVPVNLIISKGDIQAVTALTAGPINNPLDESADSEYGLLASSLALAQEPLNLAAYSIEDNIVRDGRLLYAILHGTTNPLNLPPVFMVTVIVGVYDSFGSGTEAWKPSYMSIECSANSTSKWTYHGPDQNNRAQGIIIAGGSVQGADAAKTITPTQLAIGYSNSDATMSDEQVVGLIISYSENGKIRVTTSSIYSSDPMSEYFSQYFPGGEVYNDILSQYMITQSDPLTTV